MEAERLPSTLGAGAEAWEAAPISATSFSAASSSILNDTRFFGRGGAGAAAAGAAAAGAAAAIVLFCIEALITRRGSLSVLP